MMTAETSLEMLRELDLRHLWHPYTNIAQYEQSSFTCFHRAEGVYLYDMDDRRVFDGISSWWAAALGHSHPQIVAAIQEQAGVLQHAILGNLTHPRAIELAAKLADMAPGDLNHCYFAADGASATEAALKMALQYWYNLGEPQRNRFICIEEGYHGDTLGAVGVGYVSAFHKPFDGAIVKGITAPTPWFPCDSGDPREEEQAERAAAQLEVLVKQRHHEVAALIIEPLCQGAAGIRIYPASYLRHVRRLCDEFGILVIADEIAVGFGRTGEMFACQNAGVVPDILCLGKALTGGYLPMSAAIASTRIYDAFRSQPGDPPALDRTFYDGHTFCGNPITSAAALAALEIYTDEHFLAAANTLAKELQDGARRIAQHPNIAYHKTLGAIAMWALTPAAAEAGYAQRIRARALELGLFVRPLGNAVYLWPPLTTTAVEIHQMLQLLAEAMCEN